MKIAYCFLLMLFVSNFASAQDSTKIQKKNEGKYLYIGTGGVVVSDHKKDTVQESIFGVQYGMIDFGFNMFDDKTNYNSSAAQSFLHTDAANKNTNLFSLNQSKSININIYPVMFKYRLLNNPAQKICLVTGLGLQLYNFRFNKSISYVNNSTSYVIMDTVGFKKNKLAFDYLNVPLEILLKSRLTKKHSFVYGFGITCLLYTSPSPRD